MRFSSFFALGALLLPALAAPALVQNSPILSGDKTDVLSNDKTDIDIEKVIANTQALTSNHKRSAYAVDTPEHIVETVKQVVIDVKVHTGVINATVDAVVGGQATDGQIATISLQLNLIIDLCKTVILALGTVTGVLSFTLAQVGEIVAALVALILEIVCTVIKLVEVILSDLTVVLALVSKVIAIVVNLVFALEVIVGGIVSAVLACLNVPAILKLVVSVAAELITCLTTGVLPVVGEVVKTVV